MNRISVKNKNNESITIRPFGYLANTNEYLYSITRYYDSNYINVNNSITAYFNRKETKEFFIDFIKDKHYRFNAMGLYYEEV